MARFLRAGTNPESKSKHSRKYCLACSKSPLRLYAAPIASSSSRFLRLLSRTLSNVVMASSSFPCSARATPARYILFASTEWAAEIFAGAWERRLTGKIAAKLRQAINTLARDEPQRTQSAFGGHRHCLRATANIFRKCHPWLTRLPTDRPRLDARPDWKTLVRI